MKAAFTTADTERTESAQRLDFFSLRVLCLFCVSVVNLTLTFIQGQLTRYRNPLLLVCLPARRVQFISSRLKKSARPSLSL
jgi:hypothetical protein